MWRSLTSNWRRIYKVSHKNARSALKKFLSTKSKYIQWTAGFENISNKKSTQLMTFSQRSVLAQINCLKKSKLIKSS